MVKSTLLHAGLHKTASTSFQVTCSKNRELLKSRGFIYPNLFNQDGGVRSANHSYALFNIFSRSRMRYHNNAGKTKQSIERDLLAYRERLRAELMQKGNLILSGEDTSALHIEDQHALAIHLATYSQTLKTFAVIRSPYSMHCSEFAGMIRNGRDLKPTSFRSQQQKIRNLSVNFRERENIEQINFFPFLETVKSSQGPSKFLLEKMGVNNVKEFTSHAENEGLSNEQTRDQMTMNSKNPRIIEGKINQKWELLPTTDGPKFLLTKKELELIMPELLNENK